jgi:hypothetical protein
MELDANRPIAPRIPALGKALLHEKPPNAIAEPRRAKLQIPFSAWNSPRCHGISG